MGASVLNNEFGYLQLRVKALSNTLFMRTDSYGKAKIVQKIIQEQDEAWP